MNIALEVARCLAVGFTTFLSIAMLIVLWKLYEEWIDSPPLKRKDMALDFVISGVFLVLSVLTLVVLLLS